MDPGLRRDDEDGEAARLAQMAEDAAHLAKADLVTGMVGEFPELQGVMGGYYARAQGLPDEVADAIRDHYKPVGQGDEVPTAPVTVAVSLADKLDTLAAFFIVEERPSGSRDPYALRRAGLGAIALLQRNGLRLSISDVVGATAYSLSASYFLKEMAQDERIAKANALVWPEFPEANGVDVRGRLEALKAKEPKLFPFFVETLKAAVRRTREISHRGKSASFEAADFFADRLKVQQREAGVRHDLIDAVFALGGEDDLVRLLDRVKALQSFVATEDGANLLAGYKRTANIVKQKGWDSSFASPVFAAQAKGGVPLSYTPEKEEAALLSALDVAEPRAASSVEQEDFEGAMAALASLRAPIDAFFDKVMVSDPDETKRAARLGMLARICNAVHKVADFSKIEG
jgi:glycyl-tRNA synthetase beta chain